MCQGTSCDRCKVRFECFTEEHTSTLRLDWDVLHARYRGLSPALVLKELVGSKVFVKGSRKYQEMRDKIPLTEGEKIALKQGTLIKYYGGVKLIGK